MFENILPACDVMDSFIYIFNKQPKYLKNEKDKEKL